MNICSICRNGQWQAIDHDVARGMPISTVAKRWRVSRQALGRHVRNGHVAFPMAATPTLRRLGAPPAQEDPVRVLAEEVAAQFDLDPDDMERHIREGHHLVAESGVRDDPADSETP